MSTRHRIEEADAEAVIARTAAAVAEMVLTMEPGQQLVVDRNRDEAEMFRVRLRRGIRSSDFPEHIRVAASQGQQEPC